MTTSIHRVGSDWWLSIWWIKYLTVRLLKSRQRTWQHFLHFLPGPNPKRQQAAVNSMNNAAALQSPAARRAAWRRNGTQEINTRCGQAGPAGPPPATRYWGHYRCLLQGATTRYPLLGPLPLPVTGPITEALIAPHVKEASVRYGGPRPLQGPPQLRGLLPPPVKGAQTSGLKTVQSK